LFEVIWEGGNPRKTLSVAELAHRNKSGTDGIKTPLQFLIRSVDDNRRIG
jgi:hypothetical protein